MELQTALVMMAWIGFVVGVLAGYIARCLQEKHGNWERKW